MSFLSSARLLSFYRRSATSTTLPLAVIVLGCMRLRYEINSINYNNGHKNVLAFSKKKKKSLFEAVHLNILVNMTSFFSMKL